MFAPDPEPKVPDIPSTARLAWLLFMQPIKLAELLHRWGLEWTGQLWSRRREPRVRRLLLREAALLLFWGPLLSVTVVLLAGVPWSVKALSVLAILYFVSLVVVMIAGRLASALFALPLSMALAVTYGLFHELIEAWLFDVEFTAPGQPAFAMTFGAALGLTLGSVLEPPSVVSYDSRYLLFVSGMSCLCFVLGGLSDDSGGLLLGIAPFLVCLMRIPIFAIEALQTRSIAAAARDPERGPRRIRGLPYRRHDLIFFPLPGLTRVFLGIAEHSPGLARELIDEASATIAQWRPAQRAFAELQARALRQAADAGAWHRVVELRGPFFPAKERVSADDPLQRFIAAATDLQAVEAGGSQHRRRGLLDKAARQIDDFKRAYLAAPWHDSRVTLLYDVSEPWAQAIATRRRALTREIERDPELPNVYVVGPSLNPDDPEAVQLFRARRDLITIIERDLDDNQRGVIFLVGQRRMGKTSLLAMLPSFLGTATTIVTCDFQGLSGSEHPGAPHRWIVRLLADALARVPGLELPAPAVTDAWGSALAWLTQVDGELARIDHRVLVAVDEVERLQDAHREGWGNLSFLDFVRAAGDKLRRVRLLLVSAHPLAHPRLGPAWVDRLISVLPRTLGPLGPDDAEALLCRPVPTFPPGVYDDDAVRAILAATGRHPFLIQAVGREVVHRLLKAKRRVAAANDVERALDGVIKIAESALFNYLWTSFDPAEQAVMRALAEGAPVDPETGTFRVLREQWFVDLRDGRSVVAFPLFGRWIRDYRGERATA